MPLSESQKGRIVEQLIGALLLLQSDGSLRVSLPLVDDEGVDLIVANRCNDKSLLLQIKGRFSLNARRHYLADVRRATCLPSPERQILFVLFDKRNNAFAETCWLVPTIDFCSKLRNQSKDRAKYRFDSTFTARRDMWVDFRKHTNKLAQEIIQILA